VIGRMYMRHTFVLALLTLSSPFSNAELATTDVTDFVELVGNPLEKTFPQGDSIYARNIWDLQVFEGRLYLEHGNSRNSPPAPNAGPIEVWSYSPEEGAFTPEFRLSDHKIDHYCVIEGRLYIPGNDATESWDFGNYYRLEETGWKKVRNLVDAIHCLDLYGFSGKVFAALGARQGAVVAISSDAGETWQYSRVGASRAYTLFELDGSLFVSTSANTLYEYTGQTFRPAAPMHLLVPGSKYSHESHIVARPVILDGTPIYLVLAANSLNWNAVGLYAAGTLTNVRKLEVPGKPFDILVRNGTCYVLSSTGEVSTDGKDQVVVMVHETRNLSDWKETLRFRCETFARSFEILDGDFYFGLGCDVSPLPEATGQILRVRKEHLPGKTGGELEAQEEQ